MVNRSRIYIKEVEAKVVTMLSYQLAPDAAESLRRHTPTRRDSFDSFIFEATQWARDDGAANSFSFACEHLKAARHDGMADPRGSVPLVPLTVSEQVNHTVSRWRRVPQVPGAIDLAEEEAQHRDELYLSLGGDRGDGLAAAGRRLCSRMWSARIADGFVHPAVGAYLWNDNSGSYGDGHADVGGPLIAAVHAAGDMWGRWWREPQHRSAVEREITGCAHTLGWSSELTGQSD